MNKLAICRNLLVLGMIWGAGSGGALADCASYVLRPLDRPIEMLAAQLPEFYLSPKLSLPLTAAARLKEQQHATVLGVHKTDLPRADLERWVGELMRTARLEFPDSSLEKIWERILSDLFSRVLLTKAPAWQINPAFWRVRAMLGDYLCPFLQEGPLNADQIYGQKIFWQQVHKFMESVGHQMPPANRAANEVMLAKVLEAVIPDIILDAHDPQTFVVIADFGRLAEHLFNLQRESGQEEAVHAWNRLYDVLRHKLKASHLVFPPFTLGPGPQRPWVLRADFARLNSFSDLAFILGHYAAGADEWTASPWIERLRTYLSIRDFDLNEETTNMAFDAFAVRKNFLKMVFTLSFFYERPELSSPEQFAAVFARLMQSYQQAQSYYFQHYQSICDLQKSEVLALLNFMQTTMDKFPVAEALEQRPFANILQHFADLLPRQVALSPAEEQALQSLKRRLHLSEKGQKTDHN